ncbi:MAG: protein kinase [Acidobacteriota bacterium]|nr:MAG: protein kinase [Acidobacteriota bacterium]
MIGQTVSHYEITEKLGQGGMGEVYRARDTRLNRDVALKLLPEMFANDEQRMGRFSREAQFLASLSHPHIAAIHGLEEADGQRILVMELVEGEDLSERIAKGPIPLDEALPLALQIAEALESAHEKGIIHRDLKPANIKLTPEGKVKILDFGLAKALEEPVAAHESKVSGLSQSPTLSMAATQAGIILGTAAYMSPEQARGKTVDRRADIWAFGVVLYEMLTGRQAFSGEDLSLTLANVIKDDPDWESLPRSLPRAIRRLLERCLRKNPGSRLRSIGDAAIELEEVMIGPLEQEEVETTRVQAMPRWPVILLAAAAALVASLATLWLTWGNGPSTELPYRRFPIATGNVGSGAISPDGQHVAYFSFRTGQSISLWLRDLDGDTSREISVLPWIFSSFTWSPRSDAIVFNVGNKLVKYVLAGGATVTLCELGDPRTFGIAWSPDGEVIVVSSGQATGPRLYEVSARGGSPRLLLEGDSQSEAMYSPSFLPSQDGRRALLYSEGSSNDSQTVMVVDLAGEEKKELVAGSSPTYSPTGHILYEQEDEIWAMPFQIDSLTGTGEPFLFGQGANGPSVAWDGTLVYEENDNRGSLQLVWKSRDGRTLGTIGQPQQRIWGPRISPNGKLIAVHGVDNDNQDIWIHETERSVKTRLTSDPARENRANWSPDGQFISYSSDRNGDYDVFIRASDGAGEERALSKLPGDQWAEDWSPDGRYLVLVNLLSGSPLRLTTVDPSSDKTGEPTPLLGTSFREADPNFSPDGKYVAYTSNETGREEVFVQRFPDLGGKIQVSIDGGATPRWRRDGKEIYFVQGDTLFSVSVSSGQDFKVGNPEPLFKHDYLHFDGGPQYDVSADGQRFVVIEPTDQQEQSVIRLVQNWYAPFRRDQ